MREFTVKFESEDTTKFTNVKVSNYHTGDGGTPKTPALSVQENDKRFDVTCKCNHKERQETADIYNDFVDNNKKHMIHCRGGSNPPNKMYLNFELVFTINDDNYTACVGMNSSGSYNRWNFCSLYLVADSNEKDGYLNEPSRSLTLYKIRTSGSGTFKISVY